VSPIDQLRLFLVADDTTFFQAEFLEDFLQLKTDQVLGCALVTRVPKKHSLEAYLLRNWFRLRPRELARLGWEKHSRVLGLGSLRGKSNRLPSVRQVLSRHQIPTFDVIDCLNKPSHLERIEASAPDVIVASCSLIFGKSLLEIPTRCCINRHSGLLPDYRGIWPVFQAYRAGERWTGSTIHVMDARIDCGQVLAQGRVRIRSIDTLHQLYQRCFEISAPLLLKALNRIRTAELDLNAQPARGKYYSFPTAKQWKEFRARGGRLI